MTSAHARASAKLDHHGGVEHVAVAGGEEDGREPHRPETIQADVKAVTRRRARHPLTRPSRFDEIGQGTRRAAWTEREREQEPPQHWPLRAVDGGGAWRAKPTRVDSDLEDRWGANGVTHSRRVVPPW